MKVPSLAHVGRCYFTVAVLLIVCIATAGNALAQNLLTNGGFESYSPPWSDSNDAPGLGSFHDVQANYMTNLIGWSDASVLGNWSSSYGADPFISNGPIGYIASSGSYGLGLYFAGAGSLEEGIQQNVAVTAGIPLTFSIDLSNGFLNNGSNFAQSSSGTLSVLFMNGGSTLASTTFSSGTTGAGVYATDFFTFAPTASSIDVVIRYTSGGSGQEMWIDNASLSVVPEPSTWLLLASGGLILQALRRRNRMA